MTRLSRVPTITLSTLALTSAMVLSSCGRSAGEAADATASTVSPSSTVETTTVAVASTTTAAPQALTYVIQSGDSLSVIAERFDISTKELADWNSITDANSIKVGDEIRIPPAGAEATTADGTNETPTESTEPADTDSDDS